MLRCWLHAPTVVTALCCRYQMLQQLVNARDLIAWRTLVYAELKVEVPLSIESLLSAYDTEHCPLYGVCMMCCAWHKL